MSNTTAFVKSKVTKDWSHVIHLNNMDCRHQSKFGSQS